MTDLILSIENIVCGHCGSLTIKVVDTEPIEPITIDMMFILQEVRCFDCDRATHYVKIIGYFND